MDKPVVMGIPSSPPGSGRSQIAFWSGLGWLAQLLFPAGPPSLKLGLVASLAVLAGFCHLLRDRGMLRAWLGVVGLVGGAAVVSSMQDHHAPMAMDSLLTLSTGGGLVVVALLALGYLAEMRLSRLLGNTLGALLGAGFGAWLGSFFTFKALIAGATLGAFAGVWAGAGPVERSTEPLEKLLLMLPWAGFFGVVIQDPGFSLGLALVLWLAARAAKGCLGLVRRLAG